MSIPDWTCQPCLRGLSKSELSEYDCYKKILKAKKPKTGVPWELPPRMIKEFDKLGLSCAKLRASLSFSRFFFTFID